MHFLRILVNPFLKHVRGSAHLYPARDWLTVLTFSTIVLVGIIVWNIWAFDTVASGGVIGASSATSTAPVFSRASLDAIQTIFTNRSGEEANYVTGVYNFTDPSQ